MSEYKEELKINKHQLDDELVKQPYLYMQYQEEMVEYQKERDDLRIKIDAVKNELKELEAELFIKFKSDLFDGKKPTDSTANNLVMTSPERKSKYRELITVQQDYSKSCYNFSMLEGAVKSFEQRKKSLEKLVDMYISGYYSEVKQAKRKEQSNELRNKLNKDK